MIWTKWTEYVKLIRPNFIWLYLCFVETLFCIWWFYCMRWVDTFSSCCHAQCSLKTGSDTMIIHAHFSLAMFIWCVLVIIWIVPCFDTGDGKWVLFLFCCFFVSEQFGILWKYTKDIFKKKKKPSWEGTVEMHCYTSWGRWNSHPIL